jgi:single-stranded-DNA-specific exonuclease
VLDEAIAQIDALDDRERRSTILVAAQEHWHPGVVGIVASRLVERFNRPACVVALAGDLGVGSGRSVPGVDLGAAVNAARQVGLLVKGGGHAMAAGFTVERDRLADLRAFLVERLATRVGTPEDSPSLRLDGVLTVSGASTGLLADLAKVGPFGMGNPEPRFVVAAARLAHVSVAGTNHLRCVLVDDRGTRLDAMAFRCLDRPLGEALRHHAGAPFHFAGRLQENSWRGRTKPRLVIDDAAPLSPT